MSGPARTIIDERSCTKVVVTLEAAISHRSSLACLDGYAPFLSLANRGDVFPNDDNPGPGYYDVRKAQSSTIKVRSRMLFVTCLFSSIRNEESLSRKTQKLLV